MPQHMHNLTLASAKHLLTMGHITKAHHDRIVNSVKPKFGSMRPQQAQAPIPAVVPGAPAVSPPGTSSGYDDGGGSSY